MLGPPRMRPPLCPPAPHPPQTVPPGTFLPDGASLDPQVLQEPLDVGTVQDELAHDVDQLRLEVLELRKQVAELQRHLGTAPQAGGEPALAQQPHALDTVALGREVGALRWPLIGSIHPSSWGSRHKAPCGSHPVAALQTSRLGDSYTSGEGKPEVWGQSCQCDVVSHFRDGEGGVHVSPALPTGPRDLVSEFPAAERNQGRWLTPPGGCDRKSQEPAQRLP